MAEIITGTNIAKLAELAHKDTVNECICWLIDHYRMVGEEVVRLQDVNKKLKEDSSELEEENEELKRNIKFLEFTNFENQKLKGEIGTLKTNIKTLKLKLYGEDFSTKSETVHKTAIKFLSDEFGEPTFDENLTVLIDNYSELKNENANLTTANKYLYFWDNEKQKLIDKLKEENGELKEDNRVLNETNADIRNRIFELETNKQEVGEIKVNFPCIKEIKQTADELQERLNNKVLPIAAVNEINRLEEENEKLKKKLKKIKRILE